MIQQTNNEPSQGDVLAFAEVTNDWITSEMVCKALNINSREKAAKFLRKLWKYDFLERRKKNGTVELEYKVKE